MHGLDRPRLVSAFIRRGTLGFLTGLLEGLDQGGWAGCTLFSLTLPVELAPLALLSLPGRPPLSLISGKESGLAQQSHISRRSSDVKPLPSRGETLQEGSRWGEGLSADPLSPNWSPLPHPPGSSRVREGQGRPGWRLVTAAVPAGWDEFLGGPCVSVEDPNFGDLSPAASSW